MVSKGINANENSCNGANEQFKKIKIIIVGDSLLNGINEKGLSKNHSVKVNNIPGGTSDVILDFLKNKPDGLIVHAATNVNIKNNVKNLKASAETFSEY